MSKVVDPFAGEGGRGIAMSQHKEKAFPGLMSNREQMEKIRDMVALYHRLPFSSETIPGSVMEGTVANVRKADVLNTYDFCDVIDRRNGIAWQVKSTAEATPVTWKRGKIDTAEKNRLFRICDETTDRDEYERACAMLGKLIIDFCNDSIAKDFDKFPTLKAIGYSRLVVMEDGRAMYFERQLVTREEPILFNHKDFSWTWSKEKKGGKKEQLSALHGTHIPSGRKWWAWHGRGENQLHFSGERTWWPSFSGDQPRTAIIFRLPTKRLTIEELVEILGVATED